MSNRHQPIACASTDPAKPKSFSQSKLDHWSPLISAWRNSGLSQSAFCRKHHLNRAQFTYWRTKILAQPDVGCHPSKGSLGTSPFVPVQTSNYPGESGLRVSLPNGMILSGIDEHNVVLLKAIIHA